MTDLPLSSRERATKEALEYAVTFMDAHDLNSYATRARNALAAYATKPKRVPVLPELTTQTTIQITAALQKELDVGLNMNAAIAAYNVIRDFTAKEKP